MLFLLEIVTSVTVRALGGDHAYSRLAYLDKNFNSCEFLKIRGVILTVQHLHFTINTVV